MIIHLNEHRLRAMFSNVPRIRHQQTAEAICEHAQSCGLIVTENVGADLVVQLEPGARERWFQFLGEDIVACVEIEPCDAVPLLGRTVDGLVLARGLQQGLVNLGLLDPSEIIDKAREAAYALQAEANNQPEIADPEMQAAWDSDRAVAAERDLVAAGLIEKQTREPFEPQPEPEFRSRIVAPLEDNFDGADEFWGDRVDNLGLLG